LPRIDEPNREEIAEWLKPKKAKKDPEATIRAQIEANYPNLVGKTVRRNGVPYDAIEYLMKDLDSHG